MSGFRLPSNWQENPQYLAQVGHAFGGLSVILTATLFSFVLGAGCLPIFVVLGVGIVAAGVKEFILDLRPPENDSLKNSLMDFGFYLVGASIGGGLAALAMYLKAAH